MTRLRRSSVALLLTALLVGGAAPALAHDELIGSDPEDGTTLEAPDEIVLTFSGRIGQLGAQVAVTDPDGRPVAEGQPEVDGVEVTQDLLDDLVPGDYAVVWRVTSEDGHPIAGELGFTVEEGEEPAGETGGDAAATPTDDPAEDASATPDEADATADANPDGADVTADAEGAEPSGGLPAWAWILVVLGAGGVVALLARTWSRGRP